VKNLDELLEVARLVQPKFESIMTKIVRDSGLEPSMTVVGPLDQHATAFKVLTLAPLKSIARMVEKATNELEGDFSRIVDVVRCSVVVVTEEQLESVAQALKKPMMLLPLSEEDESSCCNFNEEEENKQDKKRHTAQQQQQTTATAATMEPTTPGLVAEEEKSEFEVVRLKNRFKTPLFNGYRDALYNIVVEVEEEDDTGGNNSGRRVVKHVCEVQLHLADIVAHKEDTHVFYEYFRTYFSGSRAEKFRMQVLQRLGTECNEGNDNVEHLIGSILRGSDVEQLQNLAYLIEGLMGDVKIALLVRRRLLELDPSSFMSQLQYGVSLMTAGHLTEAERVLRDVHSNVKHDSNEICWSSINSLAGLLREEGKLPEAEPLMREALDGRRDQLGNSHPITLTSIHNLATLLNEQGKRAEAEPLMREALDGNRHQLGNSHPDTLTSINSLAALLLAQGKLAEAKPLMREALDGRRQQLGNSHRDTLASINNLALLLKAQGKLDKAETLMQEALAGSRHQLGNSHPITLASIHNLAMLLQAQGRLDEAESLLRKSLDGSRQQLGNSHPSTLTTINNLAMLLKAQGKLVEAERFLRESLAGRRHQLGNSHPDTLASIKSLALLLRDQGKLTEAVLLMREVSSHQLSSLAGRWGGGGGLRVFLWFLTLVVCFFEGKNV